MTNTTNTRPVPNTSSPIGQVIGNKGLVYLISPWMNFWQQFVQKAAAIFSITVGTSPFSYTPNQNGHVAVSGGNVSAIALIRGTVSIDVTGIKLIPVSIGDTIKVTYSVLPTIQFVGS